MRIIFDKKTKEIVGVIKDLRTSHLPPSKLGNTDFIDYDGKTLKEDILNKRFIKTKNGFKAKKIVNKTKPTIIIDINKPNFHKDVDIYVKKAKEKGAGVEISGSEKNRMVYIKANNIEVGRMMFLKVGCCEYIYKFGLVFDRDYFPHYIGLYSFYEFLKGKAKYINLGGLSKDKNLNRFKKKWGNIKEQIIS